MVEAWAELHAKELDAVVRVTFDDGLERVIDLAPILTGALYGPLRDPEL